MWLWLFQSGFGKQLIAPGSSTGFWMPQDTLNGMFPFNDEQKEKGCLKGQCEGSGDTALYPVILMTEGNKGCLLNFCRVATDDSLEKGKVCTYEQVLWAQELGLPIDPIILMGNKWNTSLRMKLHEIRVWERATKPLCGLFCLSFTAQTQIFSLASHLCLWVCKLIWAILVKCDGGTGGR